MRRDILCFGADTDAYTDTGVELFEGVLNLVESNISVVVACGANRFIGLSDGPSVSDGEESVGGSFGGEDQTGADFVFCQFKFFFVDWGILCVGEDVLKDIPVFALLVWCAGEVGTEDAAVLEFRGEADGSICESVIDEFPEQSATGVITEDGGQDSRYVAILVEVARAGSVFDGVLLSGWRVDELDLFRGWYGE